MIVDVDGWCQHLFGVKFDSSFIFNHVFAGCFDQEHSGWGSEDNEGGELKFFVAFTWLVPYYEESTSLAFFLYFCYVFVSSMESILIWISEDQSHDYDPSLSIFVCDRLRMASILIWTSEYHLYNSLSISSFWSF